MSIPSISSCYQTQMSSVRSDFQNFSKNAKTLQSALSSGNQDQVTISENALSASLAQLASDFSKNAPSQASSSGSVSPRTRCRHFKMIYRRFRVS